MLARFLARVHGLWRRRSALLELDEELRFHLAQEIAANIARGLTPDEAQRAAMRDLGGLSQTRDAAADVYRFRIESIWREVKFSARSLRRTPAFTITAILTLALAIGANSAVFSVYYGVLRRPLPYQHHERVVVVVRDQKVTGAQRTIPAMFVDRTDTDAWRAAFTSFESTALYSTVVGALRTREGTELVDGATVSESFFDLLQGQMAAGHGLDGRDDPTTAVVISERLARRLFGTATAALGQHVVFGTRSREIVGVAAASFQLPTEKTDYWNLPRSREGTGTMIGRLRAGRSVADASAEAGRLAVSLQALPGSPKAMSAHVVSLRNQLTDTVRSTILMLVGAAALVLLAACANITYLVLARQRQRARQIAVQFALGASKLRLVRQQLVEGVLLSLAGTAIGLLVARLAVAIVGASSGVPLADAIRVDRPVLGFSALLLALTATAIGVWPACKTGNVADALKASGPNATPSRLQRGANNVLCVGQLAISVVLLVGATLLGRSLYQLLHTDFGVVPDHVVTASMNVIVTGRPDDDVTRRRFTRVLDEVRTLPGITDAGLGTGVPPVVSRLRLTLNRPGDAHMYQAFAVTATPEYFHVLRVRLLAGRFFTSQDDANHPQVMIMSAGTAKRFFGSNDPIGQTLTLPMIQDGGKGPNVTATLIGVVADVKYSGLEGPPNDEVYRPFAQMAWGAPFIVVRTSGDPSEMIQTVRRTIASVDSEIIVSDVKTLDTILNEVTATPRFRTVLLVAISGLALAIAAVGLCGVGAQAVSQRTREIGIRMALGADRGDILFIVLKQGLLLGIAGVFIGTAACYAGTRLIAGLLYGVTPLDGISYAAACAGVLAISAGATYIPARRATRIDPLVVLRTE